MIPTIVSTRRLEAATWIAEVYDGTHHWMIVEDGQPRPLTLSEAKAISR